MVAAQVSGRFGRQIDYDPAYCDVILRRFEAMTGTSAILARTGQSFEDVTAACTQPETSHDLDQGRSSTIQSAGEAQGLTGTAPRKKLRAAIGTLQLSIASARASLAIPGDDRARHAPLSAPK